MLNIYVMINSKDDKSFFLSCDKLSDSSFDAADSMFYIKVLSSVSLLCVFLSLYVSAPSLYNHNHTRTKYLP